MGNRQTRDGADGGDGGGRAGHVPLHRLHVLRRLDGDPARVERDPLAHQAQVRSASTAAIREDDQARRLLAAPGHAQQSAGPEPAQLPRAEDLAPDAGRARHRLGPSGQLGRRERVAGLVHQVTGGVRGLGQDASSAHRLGHGAHALPISFEDGEPLDRLDRVVVRLVPGEAIQPEQGPLDQRLRRLGGVETPGAGPVHDGADTARTDLAERPGGLGCHDADTIQREFLGLPQTHHQNPLRRQPTQRVHQGLLPPLSARLAGADEPSDRPAESAVHCGGRPAQRLLYATPRRLRALGRSPHPFEEVHHQPIARETRHIPKFDSDVQGRLLSTRMRTEPADNAPDVLRLPTRDL
jgi:hypothetical protein